MRIRRVVRAERKQIIFSKSIETITVSLKGKRSLSNHDFLFESKMKNIYFHFVDIKFNFVNVRNDSDSLFIISRYYKIDLIMKYEIEKAYFVNLKNHFLIIKSFQNEKSMFVKFINLLNSKSILKKAKINSILKIKLFNDIMIYEK